MVPMAILLPSHLKEFLFHDAVRRDNHLELFQDADGDRLIWEQIIEQIG